MSYNTNYMITHITPTLECTRWHLSKNAAENLKRFMAKSHDQPRTVRLLHTDHNHRKATASSSGRAWDAPSRSSQQGLAQVARWFGKKRSTNHKYARHHRERHDTERDKFAKCNDEPKPLEENQNVISN